MIIKNLTCESQKLVVKEITGDHREYDMIIQPHGTTDLDRLLTVVHPERYIGIFEIEGLTQKKVEPKVDEPKVDEPKVDEPKVDEPKVDEPKVDEPKVDEPKVDEPNVEEKAPDSFICETCGAEFASARGLANHKNKAHSE